MHTRRSLIYYKSILGKFFSGFLFIFLNCDLLFLRYLDDQHNCGIGVNKIERF